MNILHPYLYLSPMLEFGFATHHLILNASFSKKNQLGNNNQKRSTHGQNGFLNILPGKCSYFAFQTGCCFAFWTPIVNLLDCFVTWAPFLMPPLSHPSCIFAHLLFPADLVVVVQWSGLSICSQLSTYIDLCHCVYALDQLLFTIHEIPAKKRMTKHLHNVVECPLTQMRNQGSCFQINTYCFKKKLNGKQCFLLYPLAVLSILFGLVLFYFFRLTTGSAFFPLHLPMYFPTSGWK